LLEVIIQMGENREMEKKVFILWVLAFLLFSNLVLADCVDVSRITSYYIQGAHDVILYSRLTPFAYVNVHWCNLYPDSSVQLTTRYLCDSDKILIDGQACDIFSLTSTTTTR